MSRSYWDHQKSGLPTFAKFWLKNTWTRTKIHLSEKSTVCSVARTAFDRTPFADFLDNLNWTELNENGSPASANVKQWTIVLLRSPWPIISLLFSDWLTDFDCSFIHAYDWLTLFQILIAFTTQIWLVDTSLAFSNFWKGCQLAEIWMQWTETTFVCKWTGTERER